METSLNIYNMLPKIGAFSKWLKEKEAEAQEAFGMELKLRFSDASNEMAIDAILKLVSDVLSVPVSEILAENRKEHVREARHIIMYLCKKHIPKVNDTDISDYLHKERTSVGYACNKIKDLLRIQDAQMTSKVTDCEAELLKRING